MKLKLKYLFIMGVLSAVFIMAFPGINVSAQTNGFNQFDFDTADVPDTIRPAIAQAVFARPESILPGEYFVVGVFKQTAGWGFGSLASSVDGTPPEWDKYIWFIVRENIDHTWTAALRGTSEYSTLLSQSPDSLVSSSDKRLLDSTNTFPSYTQSTEFKFPWDKSQSWAYTSSWHYGYGEALDFGAGSIANDKQWILAPIDGKARIICDDGTQVVISLESGAGNTTYVHLDASKVPEGISDKQVPQGYVLGMPYNGTAGGGYYTISAWPFTSCTPSAVAPCDWGNRTGCCYLKWNTTCGAGTGSHLHWVLPSQTFTVDGWTVAPDGCWTNEESRERKCSGNFSSTNTRTTEDVDEKPKIVFVQANGIPITNNGQRIESFNSNWTFSGTASDDKGVSRVVYTAEGNNRTNNEVTANGTENWNYSVSGLLGYNRIRFLAYDTNATPQRSEVEGQDKNYIDLYVDAAKPATRVEFDPPESEKKEGWYNSPVHVILQADDKGSGTDPNVYVAGIKNLYYRIDYTGGTDGPWQAAGGTHADLLISDDGTHTVEYYAVDNVNNTETPKSVTFEIDATPPNAPGVITETHGVISGQWERGISDPAFIWADVEDTGSGFDHYIVEWNGSPFPTNKPQYDPAAVRTGSHSLCVHAVDKAGNEGAKGPCFVFNYDGTSPHPPEIQNNDDVSSGVWQNHTRTADFSWTEPYDDGSGVTGIYRYWGTDENGTGDVLITEDTFTNDVPVCEEDDAVTYYLRLRSEDGVGLQSDWISYVFRYDGAAPTASLTANYGQSTVHQTSVYLDIDANDLGSGVSKMRLSNEGYAWTTWLDFKPELYWEIAAVGRREHDIYLQVQDRAGNVSEIISDTVYLDVNAPLPQSENFHLWNSIVPGGADIITSTAHVMRATLGQPADSPRLTSGQYILRSGFQAGALAAPEAVPTYTSYMQLGSLFASATTSATEMASSGFKLYGSLGQPSHMQAVTSTHYVASLGFWGGVARDVTPVAPPPVNPPVSPECEFYGISINDGALFTSSPLVSLDLCGPDPVEMMVSNDGGFGSAAWQPYTGTVSWTLTTYGSYVLPRFAYARYRDSNDNIHGTFFDDIIYDPNPPAGEVTFDLTDLLPATGMQTTAFTPLDVTDEQTMDLFLSVMDDSSGVAEIQVSQTPDFKDAVWEPYAGIVPVTFEEDGTHTVYVRTRDNAKNVFYAAKNSPVVDTTPPQGTASVLEDVVSPYAVTVTVVLSATDATAGLNEVRISHSAAFTDTLWEPYATQVQVPGPATREGGFGAQPVLYIQLRDGVGNESEVFTTTYQVDMTLPTGSARVVSLEGSVATLQLNAKDDLSAVTKVWLSPDFWFLREVTITEYKEIFEWDFGDNPAVYVKFEDATGNFSSVYWVPAEAALSQYANYLPLVVRNW